MASGFITLQDGTSWHSRWAHYDLLLKTIADNLDSEGNEGYLQKWLYYILPNEDEGDIESGYCFYKKMGDREESILRILDTRLMKDMYREIFWRTLEKLNEHAVEEETGPGYLIIRLYKEYKASLQNEYKAPDDDPGDKDIFLIGGFEISDH